MTTPTSPFLEAARSFAEGLNEFYGCCNEIDDIVCEFKLERSPEAMWFIKLFHPPTNSFGYWMDTPDRSYIENRQDRIIALLLAHEIWCDENKIK